MAEHPLHGSSTTLSGGAALLAYAARLDAPKQPPAHCEGALQILDLFQRELAFGVREEVALP